MAPKSKKVIQKNSFYFENKNLSSGIAKKAVRGAGLTIFSQLSSYFSQMVSVIILARLLTPDDFGLVAMVSSISGFFLLFRRLGLTDATVQREVINHNQISTLFWINAIFSLILTLLLMAFSPLIAWFYSENKLISIACLTSLGFFIGGLSTQHAALLKRTMQFQKITLIDISSSIISSAAAIAIALLGWGYWAIISRPLILTFCTTIGVWIFCKWRPGLPSFESDYKPMLKFGIYYLGNSTLNYFSQNIDKIIIGRRFGSESLGQYYRAYHLLLAPAQQLIYPLSSVANATLSRLTNNPDQYRKYFIKTLSTISFISFPISMIMTLCGKDIVLLLLGPQWDKAGTIFTIFGIGIGIQMLYPAHSWLHTSLGRTDRLLRWGLFSSAIIITSFFIGAYFGVLGIAITYTITMYIIFIPSIYYAGKPINLNIFDLLESVYKYILCSILSGSISWIVFFEFDTISTKLESINIILRILILSTSSITLYLLSILLIFRSIKPIADFLKLISAMIKK